MAYLFRSSHFLLNAASPAKAPLPFSFTRTQSRNLPVYLSPLTFRKIPFTEVRKYTGDANALQNEIQRLVGPQTKVVRKRSSIMVQGNYVSKIKKYLEGLGF